MSASQMFISQNAVVACNKCGSSEEIVSHILIIQPKQWEKAEEMPPNLVADPGQGCLASS